MLLRWNELSLLSCPAYIVHVSLPYRNVLITQALQTAIFVFTDSLGLDHARAVRRERVEAAFPILLSISAYKERLSVMVEPRQVNWLTASSSQSSMVMTGGASVSCPRTLVLFRLMVSPKSLQACEKQSINDWSSSWVWVTIAASSANSMSLMRTLRTFVLALRRARLKSMPSDRVRRQIPSVVVSNACFSNMPKKIPKSVGARTQPCLTPPRISNGSEELPLNCTVPFGSVWKDSIMLCSLGGQPIFWENLKQAVSADQIKCLREIIESDVQGHMLFSALLL